MSQKGINWHKNLGSICDYLASEEIKQLLEVGFEYICEKDGLLFFRKRK